MTHFVDKFPLDFADAGMQELCRILSRAYPRSDKVLVLAEDVGLPTEQVFFDRAAMDVWRYVLALARRTDQLRALLTHVQTADRR